MAIFTVVPIPAVPIRATNTDAADDRRLCCLGGSTRRSAFGVRLPDSQRGFTLLEVIVVLAMIGVLTGIAVTTLRFDRDEQQAEDTARAFVQLFRAARDHALLFGEPLRLVRENSALVIQKGGNKAFLAVDGLSHLDVPSTLTFEFQPSLPLYLLPSGQSTPFRLRVSASAANGKQSAVRIVSGDAMGRLQLVSP